MTMLPEAIREQYLADGFYIHPEPIIPADMVTAAITGMDEVINGHYDTGEPPQPSPWQPGDDPNSKLVKIEQPQIANYAIRRLLNHPALGELAARVSGAKAVQLWWVQLLYKPSTPMTANAPTNVGWHQDRHYWKSWAEGSELFTVWIALSDVTADAGPMCFVRGSHHWGQGTESDFFSQDLEQLRTRIAATGDGSWDEAPAILPPGGVSFHHGLTYHASGPNYSAGPRRSLAVGLRTEQSRPRDREKPGLTRFIDNLDYCPVIYGNRNAQGLDHYDRFVDALLAHSIEPWVELYHWDLPLALHWQGGWLNRDSADWLAELAQVVVDRLSDRVTHWMTVNEPQVFIGAGYRRGANAPGMALADGELLRIAHHVLLAHGKAVQCIRSRAQRPPQIGLALVGFVYIPASESLADIDAARRAMFSLPPARFKNSWFMEPIYRGAYPQDGLDHFLPDAPPILDGDLELISQPLDFLGINIYSGEIVQAHGADGWAPVAEPLGIERTVDGRPVTPQALYWGPRFLYERYGLPIVVTENGLADQDWIHGDGRIHDTKGIDFLDRYLAHLKRAAQDGVPVGGYLVWTLMDNFEFSAGYRPRYGLVHVDFATQKRTWKNSAYWYRDTIAANGANLEVIS